LELTFAGQEPARHEGWRFNASRARQATKRTVQFLLECLLNPQSFFGNRSKVMIARAREFQTVAEIMEQHEIGIEELDAFTGLGPRIVESIVRQRYTPSPEQRERVSNALGETRERIIWGHLALVEGHIHSPD
jgi:hypothetical protein